MGRAAVFEYPEAQPTRTRSFKNSNDLDSYLNSPPSSNDLSPRRRLFILEDLPRNYVEVLGSSLLIPPSFFAAHWAGACVADYSGRSSFTVNPRASFLLRYVQFYKIEGNPSNFAFGKFVPIANHNTERYLHFDGADTIWENPEFARCYRKVSYWATNFLGPSWDGTFPNVFYVTMLTQFSFDLDRSSNHSNIIELNTGRSNSNASLSARRLFVPLNLFTCCDTCRPALVDDS